MRQMELIEETPGFQRAAEALKRLAEIKLPVSCLHKTKHELMYRNDTEEDGKPITVVAEVRYDDTCGNGHNTFAITGAVYRLDKHPGETTVIHKTAKKMLWMSECGCVHEAVAKHFPPLAPFLKWHLFDSTGPMHYIPNAVHFTGRGQYGEKNEAALKSTIVWGAVPEMDLETVNLMEMEKHDLIVFLVERAAPLLLAFKRDVESLGFIF